MAPIALEGDGGSISIISAWRAVCISIVNISMCSVRGGHSRGQDNDSEGSRANP